MNDLHAKIGRKLHQLINTIIFLEKKNIFTFEGLSLYPSEIHLIFIINEKPTNATQMAEKLYVTKGAVSQTISRLEKKGIIKKEKDPYNKNELTLTFTPLGKRVFDQYTNMRKKLNRKFQKEFADFKEEELSVINTFLDKMIILFGYIK